MKIWKWSNHLPKNRLLDFNMEMMEKLIELLNEYDSSNGREETDKGIDNIWKIYEFHSELQIISKKYGFIKRLVKNDKIDLRGIEQRAMYYFDDESPVRGKEIRTERLIMMLSVQDNPIEDLISFLR